MWVLSLPIEMALVATWSHRPIPAGLAGRAGDRTPAAVFAELDLIRVRLARTVGLLEQIAAAAAATGTPPPAMPAVLAELQQTLAQVRTAVRGLA